MMSNPTTKTTVLSGGCSRCGSRAKPPFKSLRSCSACSLEMYCSTECQKLNWPKHKVACKSVQKINAERVANPDISNPADLSQWSALFGYNIKEATQQALGLNNKANRDRCDNEIFYINVKHNPKATDLADKFTVHEVHNLPFQYAAMLFSQSMAGFDAPGILAGMKKDHLPVSNYNRLVLGILRCDQQVVTLPLGFIDANLDRLVPDPKWKENFSARIKRKERYLDPTLVPAGNKIEVEPLFAEEEEEL